ncbi:hypothetical protein EDC01DRAFT_732648 [Geopyxis carbonaria]|nr:hypothetical protein EDC01DRAFT_732648 [Geopyxis carbonaria]
MGNKERPITCCGKTFVSRVAFADHRKTSANHVEPHPGTLVVGNFRTILRGQSDDDEEIETSETRTSTQIARTAAPQTLTINSLGPGGHFAGNRMMQINPVPSTEPNSTKTQYGIWASNTVPGGGSVGFFERQPERPQLKNRVARIQRPGPATRIEQPLAEASMIEYPTIRGDSQRPTTEVENMNFPAAHQHPSLDYERSTISHSVDIDHFDINTGIPFGAITLTPANRSLLTRNFGTRPDKAPAIDLEAEARFRRNQALIQQHDYQIEEAQRATRELQQQQEEEDRQERIRMNKEANAATKDEYLRNSGKFHQGNRHGPQVHNTMPPVEDNNYSYVEDNTSEQPQLDYELDEELFPDRFSFVPPRETPKAAPRQKRLAGSRQTKPPSPIAAPLTGLSAIRREDLLEPPTLDWGAALKKKCRLCDMTFEDRTQLNLHDQNTHLSLLCKGGCGVFLKGRNDSCDCRNNGHYD